MTLSSRLRPAFLAVTAACAFAGGAASATTIGFGGFGGVNEDDTPDNGDAFASYSESGYTLTPTGGTLLVAKAIGNEIPAIYSPSNGSTAFGQFDVTRGGAAFSFSSVDIAAINSNVSYTFTGLLGGVMRYSTALATVTGTPFVFGSPAVFTTVFNSFANLAIDRLTVSMTGGGTSFTVDNVVVNAVPEPATLVLLALGLAGIAGVRRVSRSD